MKIEVSKNMLAGALAALGKLVSRMSPVEEYKSVRIVLENGIMRFHTCGPEETMEFTLNCEAEGAFHQIVYFDALQKAVRRGSRARSGVRDSAGQWNPSFAGANRVAGSESFLTTEPGELAGRIRGDAVESGSDREPE